jgi:hypothetical protein
MQEWAALRDEIRPRTSLGGPICFAAPESLPDSGYEQCIFDLGMVATRPENWHDAFNALCWLSWPRAKAALNALHVAELAQQVDTQRSRVRDRATLFDESGLVLACADAHLAEALREHDWQCLFVDQADDWEKGLAPYVGVTGRAWVLDVDAAWMSLPEGDKIAALDHRLAEAIGSGSLSRANTLYPLPLLGIPGWWANQDAAFYADESHFRRRRHVVRRSAGVVRHG